MSSNPIHLTILRRGDIHIVDLAEVQAIIPRSETRVDGVFLNEIGEEIKRITNLVGPEFRRAAQASDLEARRNPRVVRELKNLGSLIFSHLLPQAARDRLRSSESSNLYLRLDDQLVHIPWELAFDGQHFLGMKFRVGRQVITHHKIAQGASDRTASDALKVLIVSDPSETLKNVTKECEQLCEILDGIPRLEVRLIGGRGVRRISLLAALRESDIVHFAGHSQFDEKSPENSGWLLYDGLLSASEISKLEQAPLLVFSNSCQAGAMKNWQGDYLFEGQAFGLGSAFLLAGVRNYVGTFCVVHDEESRFLGVEFYRRVARGKAIGEALLEARVATAEEMGLDRLTWASYMLYGDPAFSPMGSQPPAIPSISVPTAKTTELTTGKPQFPGRDPPRIKTDRVRPVVNKRVSAWLFASLFAAVLTGFLLFMLWRPTKVVIEAPPGLPGSSIRSGQKHDPGLEVAQAIQQPSETKPASKAETISNPTAPPAATATGVELKPNVRAERTVPGQEPPTVTQPLSRTEESSVRGTKLRPSQDLKDVRVEVERLQPTTEGEVVVFLQIINKTGTELAIVLGDADPFTTDDKGFSYHHIGSSGIKPNYRNRESWTYIPPNNAHSLSMRFSNRQSSRQRNSIYSISAEVVLASRDDVERARLGFLPNGARTVNISLHGIQAQ